MTDEKANATIALYLIASPGIEEQRERLQLMLRHVAENAYADGKREGYAQATKIEAYYPPHHETPPVGNQATNL